MGMENRKYFRWVPEPAMRRVDSMSGTRVNRSKCQKNKSHYGKFIWAKLECCTCNGREANGIFCAFPLLLKPPTVFFVLLEAATTMPLSRRQPSVRTSRKWNNRIGTIKSFPFFFGGAYNFRFVSNKMLHLIFETNELRYDSFFPAFFFFHFHFS